MSFYDPKTAYSILMGLAGAIRRLARLEEAASIALGELQHTLPDRTVPALADWPAKGPTDDIESLLVLAADLEARGRKLALRNRSLFTMHRNAARHAAERYVSRETRNADGGDEAPDTERNPEAHE